MRKMIWGSLIGMVIFLFISVSNAYANLTYILKEEHEFIGGTFRVRLYIENYGNEELEATQGLHVELRPIVYPQMPIFGPDGPILSEEPMPDPVVIDKPFVPILPVEPHSRELVEELHFIVVESIPDSIIFINPVDNRKPSPESHNQELLRSNIPLVISGTLIAGIEYLMTAKVGLSELSSEAQRGQIKSFIYIPTMLQRPLDKILIRVDEIDKNVGTIKTIVDEIKSIHEEFRSHFEYRTTQLMDLLQRIYNLLFRTPSRFFNKFSR